MSAGPAKTSSLNLLYRYAPAAMLAMAWLALYGPVYLEFADGPWRREENGHVPFVMAICIGTAWARWRLGGFSPSTPIEFAWGLGALTFGLALYVVGRISEAVLLLSASQSAIALAIVLCAFGRDGAKRLWFPLLLSLYLIIWPGWAIDGLTAPLKQALSAAVSNGLFAVGLPVAHSGAVISAGSYELLVADACSGLNSMIALTAVGAVYLYMVRRQSLKTNLAVILSILPIAIIANGARVAMLVLITYFAGYDAGQSFLHEGAGLFMFAAALGGVFAVDGLAARLWEAKQ